MCNNNVVKIHSLADFFKEIKVLRMQKDFPLENQIYYRGHASINWKMQPFLFRDRGWWTQEWELYDKSQIHFPEIFRDCKTQLERIVTMQHCSMATRLFDVTKNPLVALYFACLDSKNCKDNKDGVVFYTIQTEKPLEYAQVVTDLFMLLIKPKYPHNVTMDAFKENDLNDYYQKLNYSVSFNIILELLHQPFLFQPVHNNERIKAQQGAMIYSNIFEKKDDNYILQRENVLLNDFFEKKYFVIPYSSKKDILEELSLCGINEATLFPDAEHKLSWLRDTYKNPQKGFFE